MATFTLTPKYRVVPSPPNWGSAAAILTISEQTSRAEASLRDLERHYKIRARLDSTDIWRTNWNTETLQKIARASYPLRSLLDRETTVRLSTEWLAYWEVYSQFILPSLTDRMRRRLEGSKTKTAPIRSSPFRSFHIGDDHSSSIASLQKIINRVEYETSVRVGWEWMAVHGGDLTDADKMEIARNSDRWVSGVDGSAEITVPNMRAWKNKIAMRLKTADAIIVNSRREEVGGIAFAIMNLAPSGYAIVGLPQISSAATASMIHLFAQCFETSAILHAVAEDRLFLCGDGFLNNLPSKQQKLLYDYCESDPGRANQTPFTMKYLASDEFNETLDHLIKVNSSIQDWRYEYYDRMLSINEQLLSSASARTFEQYTDTFLSDKYKDQSDEWIAATGFNFVAQ